MLWVLFIIIMFYYSNDYTLTGLLQLWSWTDTSTIRNITHLPYFSVSLERQRDIPLQSPHCVRFEPILQPREWNYHLHVSSSLHISHGDLFFLVVTVVVMFVLSGFTLAELKTSWCTTRLHESPSIFWSQTQKLPPNIFQRLSLWKRYG